MLKTGVYEVSKDQTDWKHKYKEAAIELERYESSQVEEQMRLIISHMTLGLQGQSESLDSALSHIRQTLTSASNSLDRKSIAELEKQVRYLDREREKQPNRCWCSLNSGCYP